MNKMISVLIALFICSSVALAGRNVLQSWYFSHSGNDLEYLYHDGITYKDDVGGTYQVTVQPEYNFVGVTAVHYDKLGHADFNIYAVGNINSCDGNTCIIEYEYVNINNEDHTNNVKKATYDVLERRFTIMLGAQKHNNIIINFNNQ